MQTELFSQEPNPIWKLLHDTDYYGSAHSPNISTLKELYLDTHPQMQNQHETTISLATQNFATTFFAQYNKPLFTEDEYLQSVQDMLAGITYQSDKVQNTITQKISAIAKKHREIESTWSPWSLFWHKVCQWFSGHDFQTYGDWAANIAVRISEEREELIAKQLTAALKNLMHDRSISINEIELMLHTPFNNIDILKGQLSKLSPEKFNELFLIRFFNSKIDLQSMNISNHKRDVWLLIPDIHKQMALSHMLKRDDWFLRACEIARKDFGGQAYADSIINEAVVDTFIQNPRHYLHQAKHHRLIVNNELLHPQYEQFIVSLLCKAYERCLLATPAQIEKFSAIQKTLSESPRLEQQIFSLVAKNPEAKQVIDKFHLQPAKYL